MKVSIIAFDDFTDIDVFFMWDLLKRVRLHSWDVRIVGEGSHHTSSSGLTIPMHGHVSEANDADAVLFASGPGTRKKCKDEAFLREFALDPDRQMIGSMCSGALILGALGLLRGRNATTYPTVKRLLEGYGVTVVERPFVLEGNVATAAGCLAAQYLAGWVVERGAGAGVRDAVLKSIQPVGEGLSFDDAESLERVYVPARRAAP
jgi:transcriptional regulator GlxA family with amidase domain